MQELKAKIEHSRKYTNILCLPKQDQLLSFGPNLNSSSQMRIIDEIEYPSEIQQTFNTQKNS